MSFGGAASAMNKSLKANRALLKKKSFFKNKAYKAKWGDIKNGSKKNSLSVSKKTNGTRNNPIQRYTSNKNQSIAITLFIIIVLSGLLLVYLDSILR